MAAESVDVVIIGAGAAGAAMAWSLADTRICSITLWLNARCIRVLVFKNFARLLRV